MKLFPSGISLGLAAMAVLGGGCSGPKPERLYVNLAALESQIQSPPGPGFRTLGQKGLPSASSELPGLPAQITLSDDSRELSKEAWDEVQASRDRLYKDLKAKLTRSYLAEVRGLREEKRKDLEAAHAKKLDLAWEGIRQKFDGLSKQTGPLMYRLSWLSGFPDPDPSSRRRSVSDKLRQAELEEAAGIRAKIKGLEDQYRLEVKSLLASIQTERDSILNTLMEEESRQDAGLVRQADAEAKRRAAQALSAIAETDFQPQGVLPAQPSLSVQDPGIKAKPATDWDSAPRSPWPLNARLKDEAMIYIRLQGGVFSPTSEGARDVTREFLAWRRSR